MCKVRMSVAKETKGTFQFKEIVSGKEPAIIGTLYVPKRTLEIMGFDPAKKQVITVDLGIQESDEKTEGKADPAPAPAQEIKESPAPAVKRRGRKAKAAESQESAEVKSSPAPAIKKRGGRKAKTA